MADTRADRPRWTAAIRAVVSSVVVLGSSAVGCSRDGFEDRTAVVKAGDESVLFQVDSCGLDGSTLFVVGRSGQGEILQAVVELEDDDSSGVPEATGFTVEIGDDTLGAFGPTAWALREGQGAAPGSISWSRLRGARIQIAAEAEGVDAEGRPVNDPSSSPVRVEVDARCDERD